MQIYFQALPKETPVIRVMPNTPALVGCGATVFARGRNASDKDAEITEKLFSAVGICEEVPENLIDPVTALAGSGPAYVSNFPSIRLYLYSFVIIFKQNSFYVRTYNL